MVLVQHLLCQLEIGADLALLAPRQADQGIDVIAHDSGFGRHRGHQLEFFQFGIGFLARVLGHARDADLFLDLVDVRAFLGFAEFLLDRLHLLVQVVLPLALLHLALDASADALFHLQDVEFALNHLQQMLKALFDAGHLQYFLLLLELERQVRGDGVGQAARFVDTGERGQDFRRNLLVQLHILVELLNHRPAHGFGFAVRVRLGRDRRHLHGEVRLDVFDAVNARALAAFYQHLHGAVRQFQHLQDVGNAADVIQVFGGRFVLGSGFLRHQHDAFPRFHRGFQGFNRLRPSHKQGNDHVRENHNIPQGEQRHLQLAVFIADLVIHRGHLKVST